jgi:polyhydroxyalkanoate synthesis repressor PhaR
MTEPVVIKKYSNRRLYHTEEKRYITLEEVAQLIRQGQEVRVMDHQTQEDITQETLVQIILSDNSSYALFSSSLLHEMIRLQEGHLEEFSQYLKATVESFVQFKQSMVRQLDLWNQLWLATPMSQMTSKPAGSPSQNASQSGFMAELQSRLEQYEKRIQELEHESHLSAANPSQKQAISAKHSSRL